MRGEVLDIVGDFVISVAVALGVFTAAVLLGRPIFGPMWWTVLLLGRGA